MTNHALADRAVEHLDEPGPLNTCVANGPERWARELGLPTLGTDSVTEYVKRARAGVAGYRYHEGTDGLARGDVGVWTHEALKSEAAEHVTVVTDVQGNLWRGVGSGTPSGKVARQPASGGFNPRTVLVGYVIVPTAPAPSKPAPSKPTVKAPAPSSSKGDVYTVRRGDTLTRIAGRHDTTVRAILAANPALPSRRSVDFHIARANLILVGQRIRLP